MVDVDLKIKSLGQGGTHYASPSNDEDTLTKSMPFPRTFDQHDAPDHSPRLKMPSRRSFNQRCRHSSNNDTTVTLSQKLVDQLGLPEKPTTNGSLSVQLKAKSQCHRGTRRVFPDFKSVQNHTLGSDAKDVVHSSIPLADEREAENCPPSVANHADVIQRRTYHHHLNKCSCPATVLDPPGECDNCLLYTSPSPRDS